MERITRSPIELMSPYHQRHPHDDKLSAAISSDIIIYIVPLLLYATPRLLEIY